MRGNLTGYHDSLVALVLHYLADPSVIPIGDLVAITNIAFVEDSSQRNWVDLPDTNAPALRAHADWLPLADNGVGHVDTLPIGVAFREIPNAVPAVPAAGAPLPRLFGPRGIDALGDEHDNPAAGPTLVCGEGFVQLGVDGVVVGDELYLLPGGGAVPGSQGDAVANVTNVEADYLRQIAIAQEAGDTNDIIRAFIFPFPRTRAPQQ